MKSKNLIINLIVLYFEKLDYSWIIIYQLILYLGIGSSFFASSVLNPHLGYESKKL